MASVNAHTTPRRFEDSGTAILTTAADTITVANVIPGSVKVMEGNRGRFEYTDRSVQQTPKETDDSLCRVSFSVRGLDFTTATSLYALAAAVNASAGTVPTHTAGLVLSWPNYRGASVGQKITMANCWFDKVPEIQTNADVDTIQDITFVCKMADFSKATY